MTNTASITLKALSQNEGFSRVAAAAFFAQANPTLSDIADIKTAVSEAVTNAIIHGYQDMPEGYVTLNMRLCENTAYIEVIDKGAGIQDIEKAREPLYTSKPELERSGMGFTVMESFMDGLAVESRPGEGTKVTMTKKLGGSR